MNVPPVRPWIGFAAALFVAGITVVVTLYRMVDEERRAAQHARHHSEAARFAADAQSPLQRRTDALVRLAREAAEHGLGEPAQFSRDVHSLMHYQPGYQAVEWADDEGVLRLIEPLQGNEAALNYRLDTDYVRGLALREARRTGRPVMTSLVNLVQGGQGFLVIAPVPKPGGGFIVGVLRSGDVFGPIVARYAAVGLLARITDEAGTAAAPALPADSYDVRAAGSARFTVAGAQWHVTLAGAAGGATWLEKFFLAGGITFVTLASLLVVAVALLRRQRAEALRTAEQLAGEVREHVITRGELERARDHAQASAAYKAEIIRTLSHETRTPLTAVQGYAALIERQKDDGRTGEWAAVIIKATKRLIALHERVLLLSRLEAGALPLTMQPIALAGALEEACDSLRPVAAEKGLALTCACPADMLVLGDTVYLHEVLANLLSNAIRYTDTGGVTASAVREGDRARFSVTDTGKGIDPAFLGTAFEPFRRGPGEDTQGSNGAGLGLTITRELVERMGGSIRIESVLGKGTTVHVELPAVPA